MNSSVGTSRCAFARAHEHDCGIRGAVVRGPLPAVLTDAKHGDHTHFQRPTTTVRFADGSEGTGYTYTGGSTPRRALIESNAPSARNLDVRSTFEGFEDVEIVAFFFSRSAIAALVAVSSPGVEVSPVDDIRKRTRNGKRMRPPRLGHRRDDLRE